MKKLLLSFVALLGFAALANAAEPLYFYAWDVNGDRGFNFELTSADDVIYHGTGYTMEGAINIKNAVIVNADWSQTYGNNEWPELKTDGTPVSLPDDTNNGCWMWEDPISESNHIWFNKDLRVLIVNSSDACPWEGTGISNIAADTNVATVYYNLQGMQIANPIKGNLYISTNGNKVTKVIF